jgi:uncharacterized cupin superfamily protein
MTTTKLTSGETSVLNPREVPIRQGSSYPAPYDEQVAGREKRKIGDALGLRNFGVNIVRLGPGAWSAQRHWHTRQDEFVYILEGELTLVADGGETALGVGMVAGFPAGNGDGHHLVNRTDVAALYLEVGDRMPGDDVDYPDIDMRVENNAEIKRFTNKKGEPL